MANLGSIKKNTNSKFCQTDPAIKPTEFDENIWKMQSRTKISCSSFFFFGAPGPEGDYKGDRWLSKLASLLMASQPPTSGTILPKNGSLGAILRTVSQTIGLVNMTINRAPCICHIRLFSWKLTLNPAEFWNFRLTSLPSEKSLCYCMNSPWKHHLPS